MRSCFFAASSVSRRFPETAVSPLWAAIRVNSDAIANMVVEKARVSVPIAAAAVSDAAASDGRQKKAKTAKAVLAADAVFPVLVNNAPIKAGEVLTFHGDVNGHVAV